MVRKISNPPEAGRAEALPFAAFPIRRFRQDHYVEDAVAPLQPNAFSRTGRGSDDLNKMAYHEENPGSAAREIFWSRKRRGWSINEACRRLAQHGVHLSPKLYSLYEWGKRVPAIAEYRALAVLFAKGKNYFSDIRAREVARSADAIGPGGKARGLKGTEPKGLSRKIADKLDYLGTFGLALPDNERRIFLSAAVLLERHVGLIARGSSLNLRKNTAKQSALKSSFPDGKPWLQDLLIHCADYADGPEEHFGFVMKASRLFRKIPDDQMEARGYGFMDKDYVEEGAPITLQRFKQSIAKAGLKAHAHRLTLLCLKTAYRDMDLSKWGPYFFNSTEKKKVIGYLEKPGSPGEILFKARVRRGWTITELLRKAGMDTPSFQIMYEAVEANGPFRWSVIKPIAKVLGVSQDSLLLARFSHGFADLEAELKIFHNRDKEQGRRSVYQRLQEEPILVAKKQDRQRLLEYAASPGSLTEEIYWLRKRKELSIPEVIRELNALGVPHNPRKAYPLETTGYIPSAADLAGLEKIYGLEEGRLSNFSATSHSSEPGYTSRIRIARRASRSRRPAPVNRRKFQVSRGQRVISSRARAMSPIRRGLRT